MTSDPEAVCGTCGGKGEIRYLAPYRLGEFVYTCRDCNGTGRIPAPVVPSDDGEHERDEKRWLLTPGKWQPEESAPPTPSQDAEDREFEDANPSATARMGRTHVPAMPVVPSDDRLPVLCVKVQGTGATWVCNRPSYDVVHQNVNNARPGSGKHDFKPPAPPTPSQDAEDDGRTRLLLRIKRMTGHEPVGMGDLLNVLTHPDCIEFTEAWLESSIRADYEELVKAAQRIKAARTFDLGWRGEGAPPRCVEVPASDWDEFIAALTRIEESHQ